MYQVNIGRTNPETSGRGRKLREEEEGKDKTGGDE